MEDKENGKFTLGAFSVTNDTFIRFKEMCIEDYRKQSQLFEFLVNSEWTRRHPQPVTEQEQDRAGTLKPPTNPLKRKQSSN